MRQKVKGTAVWILGGLMLLLPLTGPAFGAEVKQITLTAACAWGTALQINFVGFKEWMDEVEKETEGRVKFNYVGGPEVFSPPDLPDLCQAKTVDVFQSSPTYYTNTLPEGELLQYCAPDRQTWDWLIGSGMLDLVNEGLVKRKNIKIIAFNRFRDDSMLWTRKLLRGIDWSGLKIRTTGPLVGSFLSFMGATPTTIKSAEVPEALQRGILDAQMRPPQAVIMNKEYEYVPYCQGPPIMSWMAVIYINKDKWEAIPEVLQKKIWAASAKIGKKQSEEVPRSQVDHMKKMTKEYKVSYRELSREEYNKLSDAWRRVWETKFSPMLLPGYASRAEKILEGNALWNGKAAYSGLFTALVTK